MVTRADHLTLEQKQSSDAQQELADEIKLRAEQAKDKTAAATSIIDREDVKKEESAAEAPEESPETGDGETVEAAAAETAPEGETA